MRYIVTLFWALILGQVVGFIGAKLTSSGYAFLPTVFVSIAVGLIVVLIDKAMTPIQKA